MLYVRQFIYTAPGKELMPGYSPPKSISGKSAAVEISAWDDAGTLIEKIVSSIST